MSGDAIIITVGGVVVAIINGLYLSRIHSTVDIIKLDINSRMTELLRVSGDAREALGKLLGAAEEKSKK